MVRKSFQGYREVGGREIFFRSRMEANYARYLQWQKEHGMIREWEYEPVTFWFAGIKRGCVSYLPDFRITKMDGNHEWVEVKGYMDSKSKTKLKRFAKYFPEEKMRVVDSKWYKSNSVNLSLIVSNWEGTRTGIRSAKIRLCAYS